MSEFVRMKDDNKTFVYKCDNCGKEVYRLRKHGKGRLLCGECTEFLKHDYKREFERRGVGMFLEILEDEIKDPEIIKLIKECYNRTMAEINKKRIR